MCSSIVIVGAGNFGAATALALAQKGEQNVTLVDTGEYPNPRAASHDVSKIVRDDYPEELYMRMLVDAMPRWRGDSLFRPFYHEVGMLRADKTDFGKESIASYKRAGIRNESRFVPIDEVRRRWNGAFATANFGDLTHVLYNPTVGYAEADKALSAVIKSAIDAGIKYVIGEMDVLTFGLEGQCTGISLKSGKDMVADKVLLCTGAHTPLLLARSARDNTNLFCGDRITATGAVSFKVKLYGEQKKKFERIPVFKNCVRAGKWLPLPFVRDPAVPLF